MKKQLVLLFAIISVCTSLFALKTDPISNEEKTKNAFDNTIKVTLCKYFISEDSVFIKSKDELKEIINSADPKEMWNELDKKLSKLGESVFSECEATFTLLEHHLSNIYAEEPDLSKKLFQNELMQQGSIIAEKYDLPAGLAPFCNPQDYSDVKRYAIYALTSDEENPVNQLITELSTWVEEAVDVLWNDEEISSLLEKINDFEP
jgi:hypothetical protein